MANVGNLSYDLEKSEKMASVVIYFKSPDLYPFTHHFRPEVAKLIVTKQVPERGTCFLKCFLLLKYLLRR